MRRFLRENGLSLALFALFFLDRPERRRMAHLHETAQARASPGF